MHPVLVAVSNVPVTPCLLRRPHRATATSPKHPCTVPATMPVSAFAAASSMLSRFGGEAAEQAQGLEGTRALSDEAMLHQVLADAKDPVKTPGPGTILR